MDYEVNGIDEGTKKYFDSLKDIKPLKKAEERELIRRFKLENDLNARNEVIKRNLKYACKLATTYKGIGGITYSEIISEANNGLIKALDKYDLNQDVKLISYAKWWIIAEIQAAVEKRIQMPYNELPTDNSGFDMEDDIAYEKINYTTDDSFITDNEIQEDKTEKENFVNELLSVLNKRERDMISMLFGMGNYKEHTLDKIGKKYNISKERVRQIIETAEKKMRAYSMIIENQYAVNYRSSIG